MIPHVLDLVKHLNNLIKTDVRPSHMRDRYQTGTGVKRTQLVKVEAIPLDIALATGAAAPVKQVTQNDADVKNMGNSVWGALTNGPLNPDAIIQGQLSDCYLLIAMYLISLAMPNFWDNIFVKVDDKTVVVQWYYGGYVIQVTTSLLVSTQYNNPYDLDVRPELWEKTWCLISKGLNDFAADNMGFTFSVWLAAGLDATMAVATWANIAAAFAAKKIVGISSTPSASGSNSVEPWVQSHAYGIVDIDLTAFTATLCQPWRASRRIPGVTKQTLEGGAIFNYIHTASFPATPRLLASMVKIPVVVAPSPITLLPRIAPAPTNGKLVFASAAVVSMAWDSNADEVFYDFGWGDRSGGKSNSGVSSTIGTSRTIGLRAVKLGVPDVKYTIDVSIGVMPAPTPVTPVQPAVTPVEVVYLKFSKPTAFMAPGKVTVTEPAGTPIELEIDTNADVVVQSSPGISDIHIVPVNGKAKGWIRTIPATPVTFTYTATRTSDNAKVTASVVLAPK